jgi:hypothetical protein
VGLCNRRLVVRGATPPAQPTRPSASCYEFCLAHFPKGNAHHRIRG